jgi:multiple sugar transport system substrate-binding protein
MLGTKSFRILFLVTLLFVVASVHAQDAVTIRYVLWDTNQLPSYQTCAENFMAANPNIVVNVEQLGWDDYWTGITTGFISGNAPDVFTDHLAKYPEFVALEQLVDLQPLVERDGVATDIYYPGLAELWTREGSRYGLPKDWDTVAVVYNVAMLEAAGVDPAVMDSWTWNAEDGGTFQETIATLTLDANGNNGLSADFDKENVVQFGFIHNGTGGFAGQTQWSPLVASTGWYYTNGVWGDQYFYDDPRFISTIQWWVDLWLEHGYSPTPAEQSSLGTAAMFKAEQGAMVFIGSWEIGDYLASEFEVGFGRLPIGPEGYNASMFNGLADSIWVGTQHLEESWAWVKYLASEECQTVVGESGVVFPAIPAAAELSLQVRADNGVDVSAFTEQAAAENGTFLFPITDFGGEIATIMDETMQAIGLGEVDAATALSEANTEINELFE